MSTDPLPLPPTDGMPNWAVIVISVAGTALTVGIPRILRGLRGWATGKQADMLAERRDFRDDLMKRVMGLEAQVNDLQRERGELLMKVGSLETEVQFLEQQLERERAYDCDECKKHREEAEGGGEPRATG